MNNTKINAVVVADSINSWGNRITSLLVTMPRIVLAEFNTHRMFSRNTSSSRAIPFNKMVESVEKDPFIPIAWQRDHKGMQGEEFLDETQSDVAKMEWLYGRDKAIETSKSLNRGGFVTKQLCNRLLEPFMWTTVLVTATEWENFFSLRCPQYQYQNGNIFRSWKDLVKDSFKSGASRDWVDGLENMTTIERLQHNKGQAEIHMMSLAEVMGDAINESTPKQLKAGEWHIPFLGIDNKDWQELLNIYSNQIETTEVAIKVATARCARTSYTVIGEEGKTANYENDIKLHDRLIESGHWSPFEHCAKVPTEEEYRNAYRGSIKPIYIESDFIYTEEIAEINLNDCGWFNNFHGFIPYRKLIEK